jgi:hypothetical protein
MSDAHEATRIARLERELNAANALILALQSQLRRAGFSPITLPPNDNKNNNNNNDDVHDDVINNNNVIACAQDEYADVSHLVSQSAALPELISPPLSPEPSLTTSHTTTTTTITSLSVSRPSKLLPRVRMRAERVTSVKPMLHALSPIEAAIIHEPDLATRAWWQPTSSRAEAETYLNDLALKLRHCPLSLNDLDNWARTPALDRVSLALVRHSSTSGALALSWHRGAADAHISHALVQLIFGNDGHLEGYSAAIYDDVQVYTRTLAQLVARVLPSTPLAVDVSLLVAAPTPPVSIDVHRWSTVGDVICAVGAQLAPHLSAAKRAAHHLALLQLLRDRRVLRAAIDALALDWRGVTALAGVFGRHGLAGELLDVALAADAPEGPWVTGGAARPGGSVAATVLTCLVQAHCQKWLAPLLNSELEDWLHHGEHNENEVLALISKATLDVTSSPTASCPELLRVIVSKLVAMRPQAGDERAFIAGVVLAPFVRAFASNAVEAAAVGQGGAARKLLDATPMIAQLGENAAPRSVSLSTWRIFAPPLDAALRQFCAALADTAPKRMRADTTAEDVFGDRIQCPVPGTDAPLDTESLELLQRTLAPRSATLLTALRAACPGESLDDAIRDAVTLALPSGAAVTWSAVESLIREPPSLVGQCALRVMSDAPMVAWNDALLAGVLRHADNALQSAAIRLLNASEVRNDVSRETRLRESRAFPPSSELSLAQLQIVPRATAEPSTRKLLQTMLQCNDPKYDRSVALLAALDDASDIDVARFRQATAQQAAQRPSAPAHAPLGRLHAPLKEFAVAIAARRDRVALVRLALRTVRVAPGDSAEMAVLRVSDRELSDVVSDATWALKLAFRDQFIVGDDRRRVPLCDFAWVRELVLDGRPIAFVVLSTLDARCIDGSVASHEHTAAFVRDVVEHAAPARAADAQSARDVGSRQKFECTVNEVVFCSADSADAATPATPTSPVDAGQRWPSRRRCRLAHM